MRMDLGGGRFADVPDGASHRSLIKVISPDGVHEVSWGGLQGLSNGELPARRTPKTADYHLQHRAPDEESGKPLHHYEGGDGDEHVDIYRAVPHDVRHIEHDSWITTNPEYAHQHAQQYDGSESWPVLHASVPKKHLYWDENDPNEHGYQGPDIPEADVHDEEHGVISRDEHDEAHPQPSEEEAERGGEHFHGTAVHLPPRAHQIVHNPKKPMDVRARVLLGHLPKEVQHNSGGPWEEDADDAELESMSQADDMGPHPEHGTPPTQVVVHGSPYGSKPHGISWADSAKEPLVFHRDYAHHTFGGKTAKTAVDATGSMMVAFVPPKNVIDHLVQEGGETADELHITLLYLGKESAFTPKQVAQLPTLVSQWAKGQHPMQANTQGAGTFISKDNHKNSHVMWASVNIPGVTRAHDGLVDFLRGHGLTIKEDFGYIPHITLKYDKYHVRFLPKVEPMTWDITQVWFCRGDEWTPYVLGR